jgi:hypothetical protein
MLRAIIEKKLNCRERGEGNIPQQQEEVEVVGEWAEGWGLVAGRGETRGFF